MGGLTFMALFVEIHAGAWAALMTVLLGLTLLPLIRDETT